MKWSIHTSIYRVDVTYACGSIYLWCTPTLHHVFFLNPQSLSALLQQSTGAEGGRAAGDVQRQEAELRLQLARWAAATGQGSQDDLQRMCSLCVGV